MRPRTRDPATFIVTSTGSTGKKATFIIATGAIYDAQTKMASFNFVEP